MNPSLPKNIRALALDLDGTSLLPDSTMGERTIAALRGCLDRGIAVLLCTGRSPVAAEPFRKAIGAEGPMVFYNGAAVIDAPSGKLLAGTLLAADIAAACVSIARREDLHFHTFLQDDRLVYDRHRAEAEAYRLRTGLIGTETDMGALFSEGGEGVSGCIKGMFIAEADKLDPIQDELDARFGGRIYRARSHSTFLEVMAAGVSKGAALRLALELRGLSPAETLALGDAENDLPMLEAAGYAVAPANATDAVRSRAHRVVASNVEEGPARFIEEFLLR